jgi:phospholipid transport system substrate-binding protein
VGVRRGSSIYLGIGMLVALCGARAAWAGPPTEQLRSSVDKVLAIARDRQLPGAERDRAIERLADKIFDFRETSKRALGLHWRSREPSKQGEAASRPPEAEAG